MPIPCAAKEIRSRKSLTAKEIPARALSGHNYLNGRDAPDSQAQRTGMASGPCRTPAPHPTCEQTATRLDGHAFTSGFAAL